MTTLVIEQQVNAQPHAGPWKLRETESEDGYELIDAEESRVCFIPASRYVDDRHDPEQQANARLIAAAPDLLAALRDIAEGCSFPEDEVMRACRDRANAAIAKAGAA